MGDNRIVSSGEQSLRKTRIAAYAFAPPYLYTCNIH